MTRRVVAAVDIGASGGRVVAGIIDSTGVTLDVVHRFPNAVAKRNGHLRWNLAGLFDEVINGLARLGEKHPDIESIGIDTWAVDYGLLGSDTRLLADPISYRDDRTTPAIGRVHDIVSEAELFEINGLQFLPFNTVYQIDADRHTEHWSKVVSIVLLPDLIAFWLTGTLRSEYTNASTTGLVDVHTKEWSQPLLQRLGIDPSLLPPIELPGAIRGQITSNVAERTGISPSTIVTTVGSHDTASAVVGVPATAKNFAYIASGTWSLVGLELDAPVITVDARRARFSNEGGVADTTRFLRNVGGLWLLQESMRTWADEGNPQDLQRLLAEAADSPADGPRIDVDDLEFIAPDDMPARIAAAVTAAGLTPPITPAAVTRCILDSLAHAYATTIRLAAELTARPVDVVHIVGGGAQNRLLCQLTADASRLPVLAGPVEATAIGNVLVQARTIGAAPTDLDGIRTLVAKSQTIERYAPS